MKTTEKISLITGAVGIAAGFGTAYLLPEAHWGVYVVAGLLVGGGLYGGITQEIAKDRIVDQEVIPKGKN